MWHACDSFHISKLLRLNRICPQEQDQEGRDLLHDEWYERVTLKHCKGARGRVGRPFFSRQRSGRKSRYQRPRRKPMARKIPVGIEGEVAPKNVLQPTHCKPPFKIMRCVCKYAWLPEQTTELKTLNEERKMDSKIQWKEGVGGKRGIVGMQDCTSLRQSNYPMGWWFLLMRRLTFSCNPIPSNAMWCVWLASATALRGHGTPGPFAFGPQRPGNCLF